MVDINNALPIATGYQITQEPSLIAESYALLASVNASTSRERRVLKSAVKAVAIREYDSYSTLPENSRKAATLRAVRHFLRVATETPAITAGITELPTHADLLPAAHPLSKRRGTDESRARWMSADPAVSEHVRPLVASALSHPHDSVEGIHARERLSVHELPSIIVEHLNK